MLESIDPVVVFKTGLLVIALIITIFAENNKMYIVAALFAVFYVYIEVENLDVVTSRINHESIKIPKFL